MQLLSVVLAVLAALASPQLAVPGPALSLQRIGEMGLWASALHAPVYASVESGNLEVWDSRTITQLHSFELPATFHSLDLDSLGLRISDDGKFAAVATATSTIDIVDTGTGSVVRRIHAGVKPFVPTSFSGDGRLLAVGLSYAGAGYVDLATGRVQQLRGAAGFAAFMPGDKYIATLNARRDALLLFDRAGHLRATLRDGGGIYGPVVFSSDAKLIVTAGDDPSIPPHVDGTFDPSSTAHDLVTKVWDTRTHRLLFHPKLVRVWQMNPWNEFNGGAFAFFSPSTLVAVADGGSTIYDLRRGRALQALQGAPYGIDDTVQTLSTSQDSLTFWRWDASTEIAIARLPIAAKRLETMAVSEDGLQLTIKMQEAHAAVFDLRDLTSVHEQAKSTGADALVPSPFACTSDGRICASFEPERQGTPPYSTSPRQLDIIATQSGSVLHRVLLEGRPQGGFVDGGRFLVVRNTALEPTTVDSVAVIDVTTGTVLRTIRTALGQLLTASHAPVFVVRGNSGGATYDANSGASLGTFDVPAFAYRGVPAFAIWPNGTKIAFERDNGTIEIYRTTGALLATLSMFPSEASPSWILSLPDGHFAGSSDAMQYIRWRVGSRIFASAAFATRLFDPALVAKTLTEQP